MEIFFCQNVGSSLVALARWLRSPAHEVGGDEELALDEFYDDCHVSI